MYVILLFHSAEKNLKSQQYLNTLQALNTTEDLFNTQMR